MEVILLEKIANLGNLGDKVNVKAGYGRNYLLPQGYRCDPGQHRRVRSPPRRAGKAAAEKKASAETRAAQLAELEVTITLPRAMRASCSVPSALPTSPMP